MIRTGSGIAQPRPVTKRGSREASRKTNNKESSMTAIGFNIAPPAATRGSRAPQGRDASASVAAASHLESFKRLCKFTLTVALLAVVAAGIVAVKIAIWTSIIDVFALLAGSRRRSKPHKETCHGPAGTSLVELSALLHR
jgi:hypothetical protein